MEFLQSLAALYQLEFGSAELESGVEVDGVEGSLLRVWSALSKVSMTCSRTLTSVAISLI